MRQRYLVLLSAWLLVLGFAVLKPTPSDFPASLNLGLREPVDDFQHWLIKNRKDHPIFTYFFDPLSDFIEMALDNIEEGLMWIPALSMIMAVLLTVNRFSGFRMGMICAGGLFLMGAFGLWEKSMETLALMLISVFFSLLIGIPLGIWMAMNKRVELVVRPVLDAMQTMPTFVYLIPAILFFGVAGVPSMVATVIYAMPPAARLTFLGIKQVPAETIEAAQAFGSNRRQILFKVQLPIAMPSIIAGVNQTIMMALGMVVIAALIGAGGLGREVQVAMKRLRVGAALEAGLAVVAMAIVLDRLSYAASRIEPRRRHNFRLFLERLNEFATEHGVEKFHYVAEFPRPNLMRKYWYWMTTILFLAGLTVVLRQEKQLEFPEAWNWSIQDPVDNAVEWAQLNLYEIEGTPFGTGPFSDFVTINMLLPLRDLLEDRIDWRVLVVLVVGTALVISGGRIALLALIGLLFIGMLGMWDYAMDTLSQVIIAVVIAIIMGMPLGIWSARNKWVDWLLRPILDTLQTIPTLVYLVPMIMLFNLGRVPGVMASILYALPPVIRLTALGIRQVDKTVMEAAQSFGSSPFQLLYKVQLPLALPTIMVGINQTVMLVLAMVVVAGLVGGSGLGFEVVSALAQNELGRGLEAGLAIVALAVILDRITQSWSAKRAAVITAG